LIFGGRDEQKEQARHSDKALRNFQETPVSKGRGRGSVGSPAVPFPYRSGSSLATDINLSGLRGFSTTSLGGVFSCIISVSREFRFPSTNGDPVGPPSKASRQTGGERLCERKPNDH
jgi:hypothetical protein